MQAECFQKLLLDLAKERSIRSLLNLIVERLASNPNAALARLWLIQPGDQCSRCLFRNECPQNTDCLHLVSSAGNPLDQSEDWSRTNGDFRRIPLGVRKVGKIAATGECVEVPNIRDDYQWVARPEWTEKEKIVGLCGQPLIFQGEVLGVLVVFTRNTPEEENTVWLRMIADHAAAAIVNARGFEEIERLKRQLELENTYLKEEINENFTCGEMVGQSQALQNVIRKIDLVAPTDASVLILGESGTGKELVAREIHKRSNRKEKPLIKVNCASIPKELYESEFFGHIKGAFTGAVKDRMGRFQAADSGTLFLDEVGEIPLELQSKLLRVLQEGTYERVGEEKTRKVDVRIVAAANKDMKSEVDAGRFRSDLYYRLNVFPVEIPPLRERLEDIPLLAVHFLKMEAKKLNCSKPQMTEANIMQLQNYHYPGNARELQNIIQRAVITSRCGPLKIDLPAETEFAAGQSSSAAKSNTYDDSKIYTDREMKEWERKNIEHALEQCGWKVYGSGGTAERLGIKPTTLMSKMKKMSIKKPN